MSTGSNVSNKTKTPARGVLRGSLFPILAVAIVAAASSVTLSSADARLGGGSSFGSRGSRTFSAPAPTQTAPSISPFQRSETPRPSFGGSGFANNAARPGFFGGGFGRGLLGGFLGAGLFGMLFGGGFGGGLGGGMSIIGLILQLGLLYLAFRFIMGFFRNRQSAGGASTFGGTSYAGGAPNSGAQGNSAMSGFGGLFGGANRAAPRTTPITIGPDDYQAFERRLQESQAAYSNGDVGALRRIATPEMAGNFEQELAGNDRQGVVNHVSDVRLVSGDLSEAWREGNSDYATVAMKFSLIDVTTEKQTNRVVDGNASTPQQVTEVWTFVRQAGSTAGNWLLSGIQQA